MTDPTLLSLERQHPRIQHRALAIAQDFFAFVRHPTRRHPRPAGLATRAGVIFTLLALNLLFNLLVVTPVTLVLHRTIGLSDRSELGSHAFLFGALAIAPALEELVFRAGLRSARWTLFAMPAMIAALLHDGTIALSIAGLTGAIWLIDRLHLRRLPAEALARARWRRGRAFIANYALIVRVYAVAFALMHLSNFVVDSGIGWRTAFLVLAVVSQLVSGVVLSYLRLRHGLGSAMAAHFSWNALAAGIDF